MDKGDISAMRPMFPLLRAAIPALISSAILVFDATAQVHIAPRTTAPTAWERFALRVVNQRPEPIVTVELTVPEAVEILGAQAPPGWTFVIEPATDSTPQRVRWAGSTLAERAFEEFAVLGRVEVGRRELLFGLGGHVARAEGTRPR